MRCKAPSRGGLASGSGEREIQEEEVAIPRCRKLAIERLEGEVRRESQVRLQGRQDLRRRQKKRKRTNRETK